MDRREFLTAGMSLTGSLLLTTPAMATVRSAKFKAIAFDAFPIFDPRPVSTLCETLFPNRGNDLINLWRTRQFEYTWLRTISNHYADFEQVTDESLTFAAKALKLDMTPEKRAQLLGAYFRLKTWPDVIPVLSKLKEAGIRLVLLSNFTSSMLDGCIQSSGLKNVFEKVLSTDSAKAYKPNVRAYQLGVAELKLHKKDILFVAFAGWDAAGAKSFGYPTFWVNRLGLPSEELGVLPDATGSTLTDLLAFIS